MPIGPKRLPFLDHIAELRRRLIIVVSVVSVASLVLYTWAWDVYGFLLAPVMPYLKDAGVDEFKVGGPFEGFTLRFKVAMYAAIVLTSPVIIWQVMAFFLPALKPKERRYVVPTFLTMVILFIAGVVFCYQVVVPVGFAWMIDQTTGSVVGQLGMADRWFQGVMLMLLAFGLGFQLPVIVFYLMIFNVVPYKKLRQNWRVAYVVIMITSAIATPDWSPVTMGSLFLALVLLYELSMLLARVVLSKRIAAQQAAELAEG